MNETLSRRNFLSLAGLGAAATLAGCASSADTGPAVQTIQYNNSMMGRIGGIFSGQAAIGDQPDPAVIYAAEDDGGFHIPAVPYQQIDPRYYRQRVQDPTGQAPGTVVVDTPNRFLYVVEQGGTAMRYGIGVGREGFAWAGQGVIQWRQKWPRWNPPDEMVARDPKLVKYSIKNGGMGPGLMNPLGARALYIFTGGQDSLYRLHGNPEWRSIGKAVSSGCVRLLNQDVIDLYDRVPDHAPIVVMQ